MTNFEKCKDLFKSLDFLVDNDKGNTDEADQIRDELDELWAQLSKHEQEEIAKRLRKRRD